MIYLACLAERTEDKIAGYQILKTKYDLDLVVADTTRANNVIIRSDFASEYFTPSALGTFIENCRRINRNIIITLEKGSNVLTTDRFLSKLAKCRTIDEVLNYAVRYEKEFMDTIRTMDQTQTMASREMLSSSSTIARLQHTIELLNERIDDAGYALSVERENKQQYANRLNALVSRINYQYDAGVDQTKMFHVEEHAFDKVLYIKEISRVQYVDSLVYYLKEILRVMYSMPTRVCVLEAYYASGKVELYDMPVHYELQERDVIRGDILMLGFQPNLMQDILKNPSSISILIVLDRGGYAMPHLSGNKVEYLYTASDINDVSVDIPKSRIISYSDSTLFIPHIDNFDKLDASEKITKYSSTGVVKKIVGLLESR